MFPNLAPKLIEEYLERANGCVPTAAEALLDESGGDHKVNDSSSDSELEQSPFGPTTTCGISSVKVQLGVRNVMEEHKQNLMLEGIERINIRREDLWRESIAVFKNPKFKVKSAPMVRFEGEAGIDGGGLRKEYGSLLSAKIFSTEAKLFEGIEDRKMPIFSVEGIQSRLFQVVGKMISYLIVHLDIGIPFLSPPVYQYIVHGSLEDAASSCSIKDICDFEIQELITKVISAKSEDDLAPVKRDGILSDCLVNAGWLEGICLTNRELAIQTLMVHFVLQKRKEPIAHFCKGLSTLGILNLVRSQPEMMKKYFIAKDKPLTSEDIVGLLTLEEDGEPQPLDEKSLCV